MLKVLSYLECLLVMMWFGGGEIYVILATLVSQVLNSLEINDQFLL